MSPLNRLRAIRDLRNVHGTAKAVLFALALRCDERGVCWPAIGTIAEDAGLGRTAAGLALQRLEADGWVSMHRAPGQPARVILADERLAAASSEAVERDAPGTSGVSGSRTGGIRLPDRGDPSPGQVGIREPDTQGSVSRTGGVREPDRGDPSPGQGVSGSRTRSAQEVPNELPKEGERPTAISGTESYALGEVYESTVASLVGSYGLPSFGHRDVARAVEKHGPKTRAERFVWLPDAVARFVADTRETPAAHGGFKPQRFLDWLNTPEAQRGPRTSPIRHMPPAGETPPYHAEWAPPPSSSDPIDPGEIARQLSALNAPEAAE